MIVDVSLRKRDKIFTLVQNLGLVLGTYKESTFLYRKLFDMS